MTEGPRLPGPPGPSGPPATFRHEGSLTRTSELLHTRCVKSACTSSRYQHRTESTRQAALRVPSRASTLTLSTASARVVEIVVRPHLVSGNETKLNRTRETNGFVSTTGLLGSYPAGSGRLAYRRRMRHTQSLSIPQAAILWRLADP